MFRIDFIRFINRWTVALPVVYGAAPVITDGIIHINTSSRSTSHQAFNINRIRDEGNQGMIFENLYHIIFKKIYKILYTLH